MGRLSFLAQVAGEGYQDSCQTTNTSCTFQNLPCGLDFDLTVQAQGAQCNSTPSVSESLETGNPATNVLLTNKQKTLKLIELIVTEVLEKDGFQAVYFGKYAYFKKA